MQELDSVHCTVAVCVQGELGDSDIGYFEPDPYQLALFASKAKSLGFIDKYHSTTIYLTHHRCHLLHCHKIASLTRNLTFLDHHHRHLR